MTNLDKVTIGYEVIIRSKALICFVTSINGIQLTEIYGASSKFLSKTYTKSWHSMQAIDRLKSRYQDAESERSEIDISVGDHTNYLTILSIEKIDDELINAVTVTCDGRIHELSIIDFAFITLLEKTKSKLK